MIGAESGSAAMLADKAESQATRDMMVGVGASKTWLPVASSFSAGSNDDNCVGTNTATQGQPTGDQVVGVV